MSQTSPPIKPRSKFDTGLGTRKGVVGEHYVNEALARGSSEFAFPMQELVTEWCWGNIWNCPSLDRKQRSLLNLGMLIALKSWPEVGTETEIRESILQSAVYCGVPAGLEAMKVATAVIDGMVAKGEHVRQLVG
ncbi:hypothetical protein COCSADRAFT_351674 [Bipolaris sorokiniana ND90Pr]|uniref:Uncharacterized protein n=1 Tax=Cochliobolus sativus (strain ND90Pr / ATCC 201652) TaxID=665912 RepID=M2SXJ4_COCSN|nr:uncharacterized protein COCSADRAFT_351674 [Bipolaris sorokiniana ND90Pr]EMD67035.1 hypothetical protein COCSADRAFT_351674 [Bipolaris sorokiniana ND90Pr]